MATPAPRYSASSGWAPKMMMRSFPSLGADCGACAQTRTPAAQASARIAALIFISVSPLLEYDESFDHHVRLVRSRSGLAVHHKPDGVLPVRQSEHVPHRFAAASLVF